MRDKVNAALSYIDSQKLNQIDIYTNVYGGGISSRIDAAIVSMMNCIMQYIGDEELVKRLKEHDRSVLVPDSRRKMSKTILGKGARAREQKSYR